MPVPAQSGDPVRAGERGCLLVLLHAEWWVHAPPARAQDFAAHQAAGRRGEGAAAAAAAGVAARRRHPPQHSAGAAGTLASNLPQQPPLMNAGACCARLCNTSIRPVCAQVQILEGGSVQRTSSGARAPGLVRAYRRWTTAEDADFLQVYASLTSQVGWGCAHA